MFTEYIKGMLMISVEGVNLERFINKCNAERVPLYNVTRDGYDRIFCRIRYGDLKQIFALNRQTRCRIRIKGRWGLKFWLHRVGRRKAFVIGAAMFVVFLFVLSSAIWRIDVSGTNRLTATRVLEVVRSAGATVGSFKSGIDVNEIQKVIKKELKDVDWVIVEFKGVVMDIRVVETVIGVTRDDQSPTSIISEVNGEIIKISALRGDKMVQKGSTVSPGQVLISGIYDRLQTDGYYKIENSSGSITARVKYQGSASIDINDIEKRSYTGNIEVVRELWLFGIKLFGKNTSFDNYDEQVNEYDLSLIGRMFPIKAIRRTYKEYTLKNESELYSLAQAKVMTKAYNDAKRLIPIGAEIESQSIEYSYDSQNGILNATTLVTAIHTIGVSQSIPQADIDLIKAKAEELNKKND